MTELNRELKEYLSRSDGKSESKEPLLPTTIRDIKIPKIGSWFTRNGTAGSEEEDTASSSSSSSWFSSAQSDPCLPSLRLSLTVSLVIPYGTNATPPNSLGGHVGNRGFVGGIKSGPSLILVSVNDKS
nr:uncharacterized protein LOC113818735 [Penaeus vannamei]